MNGSNASSALVDANVVLRFLTRQPIRQGDASARLFDRGQRGEIELIVPPLVIAEVVYVLELQYGYSASRVHAELSTLFDTEAIRVEHEADVRGALALRGKGPRIDFLDAYLAERARRQGVHVASFDRDLARAGASVLHPT